jgi:hypothetical protein
LSEESGSYQSVTAKSLGQCDSIKVQINGSKYAKYNYFLIQIRHLYDALLSEESGSYQSVTAKSLGQCDSMINGSNEGKR